MVKGISRQVIVVQSPDPKMFEQAIFILKDDVICNEGITNEMLLEEAKRAAVGTNGKGTEMFFSIKLIWALIGAACTGLCWLLTML